MKNSANTNITHQVMARVLLRAVLVIALVTVAVFLLIRLVPGDPVVMVLGEHATNEAVNQLREQLHLNDPIGTQFLIFLQNVFLHADTGNSIKYGISCRSLILQYAPVTLLLVAMSMTISIIAALLFSFAAATHKDGIVDHVIRIVPTVTHGMPVFWVGLILILFFSVNLKWFPVGGLRKGTGGMIYSLILPSVTVSFGQIPPLVRSMREQLIETLDADFVLTLRAAKLPRRVILWKHVLHNAVVPTLMLLSVNLSYLIGGTLVVEQVFAVKGIGKLLFEAISNRDFPLVEGITLYCAFFVVLISLIVDLIAKKLDPRMAKV